MLLNYSKIEYTLDTVVSNEEANPSEGEAHMNATLNRAQFLKTACAVSAAGAASGNVSGKEDNVLSLDPTSELFHGLPQA